MEKSFLTGIIINAISVSFSSPSVPEKSLGTRSHKESWTEFIQYKPLVDCSVEAAALRSHIPLSSHMLTLQSHCSSINLHHPAIWSPSSHSDTQTPLTGIDLTCTSPMYKSPSMISLQFISLYKHRLICALTWTFYIIKHNARMHAQALTVNRRGGAVQ